MEHNRAGNISLQAKTGKVGHLAIELENVEIIKSESESKSTTTFNGFIDPPRKVYVNSLSSRKMESLTTICDTFLPSIEFSGSIDESLYKFYKTSASMAATPQHLGGVFSERIEHPKLGLVHIALWLLSTWFGTFILCGRASLSSKYPYFLRFSQVSQKKREEILLSWSFSSFYLFRMLFKCLKFLAFLIFFTQVDEKNENPSWKALGYCGPDPDFINQKQRTTKEEELIGPLHRGLIDMRQPRNIVVKTIRKSGFRVSNHYGQNKTRTGSSSPLKIECDVVVVGSGSGGGVVAGILAKAGYKVIVLEKGNYFARNNLSLLEGPSMDQMYEGGGLLATDDLGVIILAGSTVGGGSTINWSASFRTPQHVINEWCSNYELELFNSKLYKEAMDVVCERMGVHSNVEEEGLNNDVLRRGCVELGYPVSNIPRNSPVDHSCGWCNLGCKNGRKKGTSETWLVDLVDSGNGLIFPCCKALEVLRDKKRAIGVTFESGNGDFYVVKSKITVVACGAMGTPLLLRRSGLRNASIGKDLHLHPTAMAWGYFPEDNKNSYEGAIMTTMSTIVTDFEGSGYGAMIQTPALHPGMFSALMPWVSAIDIKERMSKFSRTAHVFALVRDKGSGKVNSENSFSYKMKGSDEENLKKGIEKMLRILAAAGAEEIGTHHCKGKRLKVKKVSYHEFERFVREESSRGITDLSRPLCSAHQMGSCKMGVDPRKSVVNQRGETWEVEGLFLADSSVFPTALGVNPMVTVQAIAYCTAQSILEDLKRLTPRY